MSTHVRSSIYSSEGQIQVFSFILLIVNLFRHPTLIVHIFVTCVGLFEPVHEICNHVAF